MRNPEGITGLDLKELESRLRGHVATLAQTPRCPGSREHHRAANYIQDQLQKAGFFVRETPFQEGDYPGNNLITQGLPEREELPLMVIGAHYDSVPGSPAADDNASGVAALLELARWIQPQLQSVAMRNRLQLAAYDLEEYGLVGSLVHSRDLQEAGIKVGGMISLEMLGYTDHRPGSQRLPPQLVKQYPNVATFIGVCGNEDSRALLEIVTTAMKCVDGLPVEFIAVPGKGEVFPQIRLSDHSSFWDQGYHALMITDTSFFRNPHYHQPSDTPDTLDYPFLARVTAGVCQAVRQFLFHGPA